MPKAPDAVRRNLDMASLGADLCIAFGDGKGTRNMIACAESCGIPVRRELTAAEALR